jgi:hypothetical protein
MRIIKTVKTEFYEDIIIKSVSCSGISKNWERNAPVVWEIARLKRKHGIFPYNPAWILLYLKSVFKRRLILIIGVSSMNRLVDFYRKLTCRKAIWTKM